jgi:hypothetical protein
MNPTLLSLQQPSLASNASQGSSAVPIPKRPNLHPPDQQRHLNVEVFTSSNLDLINTHEIYVTLDILFGVINSPIGSASHSLRDKAEYTRFLNVARNLSIFRCFYVVDSRLQVFEPVSVFVTSYVYTLHHYVDVFV